MAESIGSQAIVILNKKGQTALQPILGRRGKGATALITGRLLGQDAIGLWLEPLRQTAIGTRQPFLVRWDFVTTVIRELLPEGPAEQPPRIGFSR